MFDLQSVCQFGSIRTTHKDASVSGVNVVSQQVCHSDRHSLLLHAALLMECWNTENNPPLCQTLIQPLEQPEKIIWGG